MNPTSSALSSHTSSLLTSQQTRGSIPFQNNQGTFGSLSSTILGNRTTERIKAVEQPTSQTIGTDWNNVYIQHQPWESPTYKFGVPLNEFRPAYDFCEGCDDSDDAINSSMSVASECSLNTTSSSLEEHVLQLLENYQSDGNGSVRPACVDPVARTLMSDDSFSGDMSQDEAYGSKTNHSSPRRHSSPPAVGSSPPESASHRPAALHASASAPILYFSPCPR